MQTGDIIIPQIEIEDVEKVEKRVLVKGNKKPIPNEIKNVKNEIISTMSKEDFIFLLKESKINVNEEEFDEDIEEDKLYSTLYSDYLKVVEEYNLHKKFSIPIEHKYGEVNIFNFNGGKLKDIDICGDYGCITYMNIKLK